MKKTFLFLLLILTPLFAQELTLKEKLAEAEPGSFLVTEQGKTLTMIYIADRNAERIRLEEVSIPRARFAKCPMPWRDWFEQGAPGHTLWTTSLINLQTGRFEETFSYTHQGWVDLSKSDPFLTQLLNLTFHRLSDAQRRKIGPPPSYRKVDTRPLWRPRLIVDGCVVPGTTFTVWKARWPSDGSELSRKTIEVYIPESSEGVRYPTYFPYWLEVEGKIGSAKVRVIDSGQCTQSIHCHPPLL